MSVIEDSSDKKETFLLRINSWIDGVESQKISQASFMQKRIFKIYGNKINEERNTRNKCMDLCGKNAFDEKI